MVLVRRNQAARKIEYCWYTGDSVARGVIDDPLKEAGVVMDRKGGVCQNGDWLMKGGRDGVGSGPADFEVRVVLRPPYSSEETE